MRYVKPQVLLAQSAPTQIGQQAMLGISVGVGFRLDDPRILVHEAAVWEAIRAAPASVPLFEAALPKRCAEWLLAGHAEKQGRPADIGAKIDWSSSVELVGCKKQLSCLATVEVCPITGNPRSRLAADHVNAASGAANENPLGRKTLVPALQKLSWIGAHPEPLAGLGAIDSNWPERRQWMPRRPGSLEGLAQDGSHMGWPENVDLRYFQAAAPDQWHVNKVWPVGAQYELSGFGSGGHGFKNSLPKLDAQVLLRREGKSEFEAVAMAQQTVWFLPDRGIGVMWWHGAADLSYILDDGIDMLVASLTEAGRIFDQNALSAFALRRTDLQQVDVSTFSDQELLPAIDDGWTWELILSASDHPRSNPPQKNYEDLRARVSGNIADFAEAQQNYHRMQEKENLLREMPNDFLQVLDPDQGRWKQYFCESPDRSLAQTTIRNEDLRGLSLHHWKLEHVRFENCLFGDAEWSENQFHHVYFVDCSMKALKLVNVSWEGGAVRNSQICGNAWQDTSLSQMQIQDSEVEALNVAGGNWSMVTFQNVSGTLGRCEGTQWDNVNLIETKLKGWMLNRLKAKAVNIVHSSLRDLQIKDGDLEKISVADSDLLNSIWENCHLRIAVLTHATRIDHSKFIDCHFSKACFAGLIAHGMEAEHCDFPGLSAARMQAPESRWTRCILDDVNFTNANLSSALFEQSSLKNSMLYGANMLGITVRQSNLIRAATAWTRRNNTERWQDNLCAGQIDLPRRSS
ncbi:DUF2169 domain-containing protein [Collimonas humicola]|uniref:DUF2169 family type VI secretion system accessory protein n=1 Tax=Collimonas humicola TaxID=2825886 RepID=UPI001B8B7117|nr:pentapeptide repeat-containing protein [Collimonas humicola]